MACATRVDSALAPVRRRARLLGLALACALAHLALLGGAVRLWPSAALAPELMANPAARPTLAFRTLLPTPAPSLAWTAPATAAPMRSTGEAPKPATQRSSPRLVKTVVKPALPAPPAPDPVAAFEVPAPAVPVPTEASAVEPLAPVYRTLVPDSALLRYRVQRGALHGTAELNWQTDVESYDAQLAIVLDGRAATRQVSQGGFDGAGLAPRRFTDRRQRGGVQAANFERERGEVMFSGPSHRLGLAAGAQDRLSWMLQLGAVLQAEPQRSAPGGEVVFAVIGARGDGRAWTFRFEAFDPVHTDAGPIDAVKWVREPGGPYDTRVEVWLAPSRQYLPVRLRTGAIEGASPLEMTLEPSTTPQ